MPLTICLVQEKLFFQTDVQCHLHPISCTTKCEESDFQNICNVTHILVTTGNVMRHHLKERFNVSHILTVTADVRNLHFIEMYNTTYLLLVMRLTYF